MLQNKQVTSDATKLSAAAINYIHYYNNNSYFKIMILERMILERKNDKNKFCGWYLMLQSNTYLLIQSSILDRLRDTQKQ